MSNELAKTLVSTRRVPADALNDALQRQVVFGGSLDTSLLELGVLSEVDALEALSQGLGLEAAGKPQIDRIAAHLPRLFPLVFAETYHLVPLELVGQRLSVLVNAPPDVQLFARIKERLQVDLEAVVTTEARLHYAMHRLYGTALQPRFAALLTRIDGHAPAEPGAGHVLSWGVTSSTIQPSRRGDAQKPSIDLRGLLTRLDVATDRDEIVEVLLGAAVAVFDFAALFAVHGDVVNGWRGTSPEAAQRLARISLNVELPSVFQTIYATGGHYLGPLPQNSVNAKLLADMGRTSPRAALLAPITVGGKLAAILYADNGARGVPSKRVAAVLLLTQRAGVGFEGLIRRRKNALAAERAEPIEPIAPIEPAEAPAAAAVPGLTALGESWVVEEPQAALRVPPAATTGERRGAEEWDEVELQQFDADIITVDEEIIIDPEMEELEHKVTSEASVADVEESDYTPFADITDNPEEALDDWEDVLVETAGLDAAAQKAATAARKKAVVPSVSWQDVIAEAERTASVGPASAAPVEVAGTVVDERELLLDGLEAQDPEARQSSVDRLLAMGASIDDLLRERFPGRLAVDPLAPDVRLPPLRRLSGLLDLIGARGQSAAAVVLPHLESDDAQKRLCAIYFLYAVPYPPALGALARRLYDSEPRNRYLAVDALRLYAREPGYANIVQGLREQLKVPIVESQVAAVQVLGQLREPVAVPSLIPLVASARPELASASASALAVICGQAFGDDVTRWADWWRASYNQPRPAWLVRSLRQPNPALVRLVQSELILLTGRNQPVDPEGPSAECEAAIQAWEGWWQQVSAASSA